MGSNVFKSDPITIPLFHNFQSIAGSNMGSRVEVFSKEMQLQQRRPEIPHLGDFM